MALPKGEDQRAQQLWMIALAGPRPSTKPLWPAMGLWDAVFNMVPGRFVASSKASSSFTILPAFMSLGSACLPQTPSHQPGHSFSVCQNLPTLVRSASSALVIRSLRRKICFSKRFSKGGAKRK